MRPGRLEAFLAFVGVIAIAVSMAGCGAAQTTVGPPRVAASDDVVCRDEALTGSHIVERRCYRRSDIDVRRAKDRETMETAVIHSNRPVRSPASGTPNP
jgi:hypothetical protein